MDKQAEEIKNKVPGATVERVGEGIVVEFLITANEKMKAEAAKEAGLK